MDSAAEDTFGEEEDDMQRCAMHYTSSDGTRRTLHYRAKEEVRVVFFYSPCGVRLHREVHRIMAAVVGICQNTHAQKSIAGESEGTLSPFLPAPLLATPARRLSLHALPSCAIDGVRMRVPNAPPLHLARTRIIIRQCGESNFRPRPCALSALTLGDVSAIDACLHHVVLMRIPVALVASPDFAN